MLNYFKSKWQVATASLLLSLIATSVHADGDSAQIRNLDNRVTALEQRRMSNGVITPPARPPVRDSVDLGIEVSGLYWWSYEGGTYPGTVSSNSTAIVNGKTQKVGPKGNWGFRTVIDYDSDHDDWMIDLGWTWLYSKLKKEVNAGPGSYIFPNLTSPSAYIDLFGSPLPAADDNLVYESMNSHIASHFNSIVLGLSRPSYMSKNLAVNVGVGLEATWLYSNHATQYNASLNNSLGTFVPGSGYSMKGRNDTFGVGIDIMLGSSWFFTKNLSIFGDCNFGLLWGFHKASRQDKFNPGTGAAPVSGTHVMPRANSFHMDSKLGLEWAGYFSDDSYRYALKVCWEQMIYAGFNQDLLYTGATEAGKMFTNQGDFSSQGITFSIGLDF